MPKWIVVTYAVVVGSLGVLPSLVLNKQLEMRVLSWTVGTFVLAGGVIFAFGIPFVLHRKELDRLNTREPLDAEQLYARYYASSGLSKSAVVELWNEVASTLRLPAEKLRPGDRFGEDIGRWFLFSDDLDSLAELGEKRAKRRGIEVRFDTLFTIDDYVRALAERA
jgi:hypothetical protein